MQTGLLQFMDILTRVLPILLLILVGVFIRKGGFLKESTVDELKTIVVNFALPSLLFIAFLDIKFELSYFAIFLTVFAVTNFMLIYGRFLKKRMNIREEYFPMLISGFEYGMVGVALFGSAYGIDSVGYLGIIDIGQEMFVWFILLSVLLAHRDNTSNSKNVLSSFFRSPVIVAILLGIFFNVVGMGNLIHHSIFVRPIFQTMVYLGNLTIPLILIVIGYGIRLNLQAFKQALIVAAARLGVLVPLAFFLNFFLVKQLLHLDTIFASALFTLFILPPPFIVPLYIADENRDSKTYTHNVLMIYTLFSVFIFIIYFLFTSKGM